MLIVDLEDTTAAVYWLNWRFLLCAIWIASCLCTALFIIWKYEDFSILKSDGGRTREDAARFLSSDDAWRPCLKEIHPIWLLAFRVVAFCMLLTILTLRVLWSGTALLFYYTQWTFILVTTYFAFGSLMSMYGCCQYYKIGGGSVNDSSAEQGNFMPLPNGEHINAQEKLKGSVHPDEIRAPGITSLIFQVIFQMNAGAVMLTDCVFWGIIFPFLTIKDYDLSFMSVNTHSLNAILLLADTILNCLKFPWFRISYFMLWTSSYVIFQWILHACINMRWPYPFLKLSSPYAPLWYAGVGLLHIPCYAVFAFVVRTKHYLLSKWFPRSYRCNR